MTMLTDQQITDLHNHKNIIAPFDATQVQPNSYEVTLGHEITITVNDDPTMPGFVDAMTGEEHGCHREHHHVEWFDMAPGDFLLAHTNEYVRIPNDILCTVEGKSTIARIGVTIHSTAGWVDSGFEGQITLELFNSSQQVVRLHAGQNIAQLAFDQLSEPCATPYGSDRRHSHYQGQTGATSARIAG